MKASIWLPIASSGLQRLLRHCGRWDSRANPWFDAGRAPPCGAVALMAAKVGCDQFRIVDQGFRGSGLDDLAGFQHIAVVRSLQRRAGVLLDEEDRNAEAS